jgi:hypothetical protein
VQHNKKKWERRNSDASEIGKMSAMDLAMTDQNGRKKLIFRQRRRLISVRFPSTRIVINSTRKSHLFL